MPATSNVIDKLDTLAAEVASIQASLAKIKMADKPKKPRKVTDKGILQAAKVLFYQENKKSDKVVQMCKQEFGSSFKLTFSNYRDVKKITDEMFDGLSPREQNVYIDRATDAKSSES